MGRGLLSGFAKGGASGGRGSEALGEEPQWEGVGHWGEEEGWDKRCGASRAPGPLTFGEALLPLSCPRAVTRGRGLGKS